MQIIEIKENQKEIWNEFIVENNSEGFLQSWEWGGFQNKIGHKIWRIGIIKDDLFGKDETSKLQITNYKSQINSIPQYNAGQNSKLISVALIVKHDLPFGKSYLYCPRGPVFIESRIKNQESRILNFLFNEVRKISKEERSLFLRIDPPIDLNLEYRIWNIEFKNLKKSPNEIQPRETLMLDLEKPEEELLKEMKQKTRYNIRLAEKKELRITNYELGIDNKKIFEEKFEEFWRLTEETSRRDKFKSHNRNYYWQMMESLSEMQKAPQPHGTMEPANQSLRSEGDIRECRLQARLYLAEYENETIAANIVLYFGDMAVYLHGASSSKHRNLMAPYLLQWWQALDAKKAGYKEYDFWGIAGNNEKENWKGITRFKKGFGGEEKNYIGAYDLIFSNIGYAIYGFMKLVKSFARTVL